MLNIVDIIFISKEAYSWLEKVSFSISKDMHAVNFSNNCNKSTIKFYI